MLANRLGRRGVLAGLMVLAMAAPAAAFNVGQEAQDAYDQGEQVAQDLYAEVQAIRDQAAASSPGSLAGKAAGYAKSVATGDGAAVQVHAAAGEGAGSPGGAGAGAADSLPVEAAVVVGPLPGPLQSLVEAATANLPVDFVSRIARQAQEAADEAARGLPTLGTVPAEEPAAAPAPDAAAVAPGGPTPMVIGATIIVVGAAAAATFAAFWMAGSSGSVGAAAAAKGGAEMRRLLPFASPLFTRFGKDTVLGHPRREALYARILQEPGISLQALGEATGLSRTAVVHHLRLLEQQHLIVSRRVGRGRHYFENGGRYGHDQKEAYAVLQNDRSRAVAEAIRSRPGMMQKTLCAQLAIPPSIAHWHVTRLAQANLVQVVRQGRTVAYFPGQAMPALNLPAVPREAAAPMAASMQVTPA